MKPLALLFDLDGTLIDSITLLVESMEFAFVNRTHRPTVAYWTAGIGKPLRVQMAEWAADVDDVEALVERYREYQSLHLESLTTVYPNVQEVLEWGRARGHRIGLVTSKGRGMTDRSLAHARLDSLFDVMVTVESTERHKPLPDPVWHALNGLQIPRERALFVGDSTHDMFAGRAAGVHTAAATWGPFSREELITAEPSFWLDNMLKLKPLVEHLEQAAR
ncbi:MAG: HAD-IA family hydrolase [Phycisphaerae bacterium]|nr:HAD-IA family hydrolase [Gemmatimonadaceae bacterium]